MSHNKSSELIIDPDELKRAAEQLGENAEKIGIEIQAAFDNAHKALCEYASNAKKYFNEHKEEILAAGEQARRENEKLIKGMPHIHLGDIVRINSAHCESLNCYEVSSIESDCVISQPAGFRHRYNEIIAIYRFDGKDFKCIWERADFTNQKPRPKKFLKKCEYLLIQN